MALHRRAARMGGLALVLGGLAACADGPASPTSFAPAVAASVTAVAADSQTAYINAAVMTAPAVKVTSATGAPVAGVTVHFAVVQGGGSVLSALALTDATGVASAGGWTLGAATGTNVVEATVDRLPPVRFTATAESPFNIEVQYLGTPSAAQQAAVEAAVATWRAAIVGELPDVSLNAPANTCFSGQPAVSKVVDDLLLFVRVGPIDGAGKTLAESGPCYIRTGSSLPIMGALLLDQADLAPLEADGSLTDVLTHEIGHILGFGTLWTDVGLLAGAGQSNPQFMGTRAVGAYLDLGRSGTGVPVENSGGPGTRDGHWRESIFGNELMTGYINRGANPLSAMSIASLGDLGYAVDLGKAFAYSIPSTPALGDLVPLLDLEPHEVLLMPKHRVDPAGN